MWQKLLATIGIEALSRLGSYILESIQAYFANRKQKQKEVRDEKIKDLEIKIEAARQSNDIVALKRHTLELFKLQYK